MTVITELAPATVSRHWAAKLELTVARRDGVSRVVTRRQRGPLALQRALYPEGENAHLYLLHPPGGVVGGDSLDIRLAAYEDGECLATTPGATKFYRGNGTPATQYQRIAVNDALVEWFPQENIFFDGTDAVLRSEFVIEDSGTLIAWEINSFGRPASGEPFVHGTVSSAIRVEVNARPILIERFRLLPTKGVGNGAVGMRGFNTQATLIAWPVDAALLNSARSALAGAGFPCGATRLDSLLVARCLGDSVPDLRRVLVQVWHRLRPTLCRRPPSTPRIWLT
jgi:urease accessory protein